MGVRFDPETQKRLRTISERSGMRVSDLVRHATLTMLDQIEKEGAIRLPLNIVKESRGHYGTNGHKTKDRA
jgi:hypothetical protein